MPVHGPGGFAGVAGSGIYVREFERLLLPKLRAFGGRAALVNALGRVIVSASVRHTTGSPVQELDIPAWWNSGEESLHHAGTTLRRCGDTPMALLITCRA